MLHTHPGTIGVIGKILSADDILSGIESTEILSGIGINNIAEGAVSQYGIQMISVSPKSPDIETIIGAKNIRGVKTVEQTLYGKLLAEAEYSTLSNEITPAQFDTEIVNAGMDAAAKIGTMRGAYSDWISFTEGTPKLNKPIGVLPELQPGYWSTTLGQTKALPDIYSLSRSMAADIYQQPVTYDIFGIRQAGRIKAAQALETFSETNKELIITKFPKELTKFNTIQEDLLSGVNRSPTAIYDLGTLAGIKGAIGNALSSIPSILPQLPRMSREEGTIYPSDVYGSITNATYYGITKAPESDGSVLGGLAGTSIASAILPTITATPKTTYTQPVSQVTYEDPTLAVNAMAGIGSSSILIPTGPGAIGATPIIANSYLTQDLGNYVNTYNGGIDASGNTITGASPSVLPGYASLINSKLSASPYSNSALSLGVPSGMQPLIYGGNVSPLYSGGYFGGSTPGAPLPGYPSSYPGYSPLYPGPYSLYPAVNSPDDYSPVPPSSPNYPFYSASIDVSPPSPPIKPPYVIKTTSLQVPAIFPDTSVDERRKVKLSKYYLRNIISPELTPRELSGTQKKFQPFYDIIKPGLIAVQHPRSQEYRRRGLEGAAYEEFNGTPIRDLAGLTFHRTATKAQGGPKVMHREQAVDDVITFINTGTHNRQGKPQEYQRETVRKTESTNVNNFIQNVRGEQRPRARQERVNARMNSFNSIIGNSSTRKKKKNFWE